MGPLVQRERERERETHLLEYLLQLSCTEYSFSLGEVDLVPSTSAVGDHVTRLLLLVMNQLICRGGGAKTEGDEVLVGA